MLDNRTYARSLCAEAQAVHIELNPETTTKLREQWERWGGDMPLMILPSPYRSLWQPLVDYLERYEATEGNKMVTLSGDSRILW